MRPLLRVALPLLLLAAAGWALWQGFRSRADAFAFRAERARVKREFVERAVVARGLGDRPREAADESRALLRWYFDEVQGLRNRFRQVPAGLGALLEQRPKAGAEERKALEEFHAYAAERLEAMRSGRYDPAFTASAGGLRLDVLAVQPGTHPGTGGGGVRLDFALWGVPRRTERESQVGHTVERAALAVALRQLTLRFLDADGKPWGEMSGSGEPYLKVTDPERLLEDFPPGLLVGSWWLEPFPREAARVAVTLQAQLAGVGAAVLSPVFAFEAPVAEEWKLRPGESFGGEVREDASLAPAPGKKK